MVKAWCCWCDMPGDVAKHGYLWIHEQCVDELMDISSDLKSIREMLQGMHPRNEKDKDKLNVIYKFINDMNAFRNRWKKMVEIIENIGASNG